MEPASKIEEICLRGTKELYQNHPIRYGGVEAFPSTFLTREPLDKGCG